MPLNAADINGRVRYVEPTNVLRSQYDTEPNAIVVSNELVLNPLEDYCIAVDLEVFIPNRKSCGFGDETGEIGTLHYSSTNGTISFMHGTNGTLTTNFTDISSLNPSMSTAECFGIESIDVSFDDWVYPQVTIKFVDVRGASVMMPEEDVYQNGGEGFGSIYRALFSVPYPMFKLKLKGFYGKGATFYLCPQDTNIELDSSSGNFGITVKFVGYRFRIYADLPMSYICIAPYLNHGSEYWNEQVTNGRFVFKNRNGTVSDMIKFPEFRRKVAEAALSQPQISAAARGEQYTKCKDNQIAELNELRQNCPINGWADEGKYFYYITDSKVKEIGKSIDLYMESVTKYDETYKTHYAPKFSSLSVYGTKDKGYENIIEVKYERDRASGLFNIGQYAENKNSNGSRIKLLPSTITELQRKGAEMPQKENEFRVLFFYTSFSDVKGFLNVEIPNAIKMLEREKEELKTEYAERSKAMLEDALGFSPSIENIYNLAFAHMETFMYCFYEYMKSIKDKMEDTGDNTRKVIMYDTDTDVDPKELVLPPFPAFYGDKTGRTDTQSAKTLIWPEDIPGDMGKSLDEVSLVKDILTASKIYAKKQSEADERIEALRRASSATTISSADEKGKILENAPSIDIDEFIPVTTYDFVNKDRMKNPYAFVSTSNYDKKGLGRAVFTAFAVRAMYYMSTNVEDKNMSEAFGDIEAVNFAKAVGENYTNEVFKSFITDYSDGHSADAIFNETIDASIRFNDGNRRLFEKVGNKYGYVFTTNSDKTGDVYFPIGLPNLSEIQQAITSASYKNSKYFIPEVETAATLNPTFTFFETRDYVSSIYENIYKMADSMSEAEEKIYRLKNNKIIDHYAKNIDAYFDKEDASIVDGIVYVTGTGKKASNLPDILANGSETALMDELTVCFPTAVSEDHRKSLFGHEMYKKQTSTTARAYLYLSSIQISRPRDKKSETQVCGLPTVVKNGLELKSILLREGSFYWRADAMIASGEDPIVHDGFKMPTSAETYMVKTKKNSSLETFSPIENGGEDKAYVPWAEPSGNTPSRRAALKEMFLAWAAEDFANVEGLLTNGKFYIAPTEKQKKNEDSYTKYENGFNYELVNTDDEAYQLQQFFNGTYFKVGTVLDYYAGRQFNENKFLIGEETLKASFKAFMNGLNRIYKKDVNDGFRNAEIKRSQMVATDPFNNTDLRLSTYQTLKTLYDKWLCSPFAGQSTWKLGDPRSDFSSFMFIDSFYRHIGLDLFINASKVGEWLDSCLPSQGIDARGSIMAYNGKSVYDFLYETAVHVGGMLYAFPQRIGEYTDDYIASMFVPMPFNSDWETDSSSFVFIYNYRQSEHMGTDQYQDDGFQLNTEQATEILGGNGYMIPAFGVSYGKQNQAFFKNISLNTTEHSVTEASLNATLAIASRGSAGARESSLFGQDLYRVKTSYSYTCEFDMMGCVQIMPLMYFQLNNVPFWRGAYIVTKVSHQISQGDMVTHVAGVRINKNALPMTDGSLIPSREIGDFENIQLGVSSVESNGNRTYSPGFDDKEDPNVDLGTSDPIYFNEANVTTEKPIICIWPAHGPDTVKSCEWYWSSKLIDEYIIPLLKAFNFGDGTPFSDNIQRCNVNGTHTNARGYSGAQIKRIISKYGSKKVISIVPHWNAAYGSRFEVYRGYDTETTTVFRPDSDSFADIVMSEAKKVIARYKRGEFTKITPGAMDCVSPAGVPRERLQVTKKNISYGKQDPSVMVNCACVLTENWFVDYPADKQKVGEEVLHPGVRPILLKQQWDKSGSTIMEAVDEQGRYKIMQGWMFDTEGLQAIAFMNAMSVVRYIELISGSKPELVEDKIPTAFNRDTVIKWFSESI